MLMRDWGGWGAGWARCVQHSTCTAHNHRTPTKPPPTHLVDLHKPHPHCELHVRWPPPYAVKHRLHDLRDHTLRLPAWGEGAAHGIAAGGWAWGGGEGAEAGE